MRAAIYARRSTEEHQAASLDVQIDEAKRFIEKRGWETSADDTFIEDGVSRAEFVKRPALFRLLRGAAARAFDIVVVRDETRLGGDVNRTCLLIQEILEAGVRLFYHSTGEEVRLDDATAKMMVAVRNYASELEREKISSRTYEHLLSKARRGLNVGGRCYGYDNVPVMDGKRRKEVGYKVNDTDAAIVGDIFESYARGWGLRRIAKHLNERGVASPHAGLRGTGSWSTSVLSSMLRNERYRGVLVWNRFEKAYRGGTKVRLRRDPSEWLRVEMPELRIVNDEVWFAAQARMRTVKSKKGGRPPRYLLSGIARCGECGGPLTVIDGRTGTTSAKMYTCAYHRGRGDSVCKSSLRRPVESVDRVVTDWLAREVLDEAFVLEAIKELRKRFAARARTKTTEVPVLKKEAGRLRTEIDRLVRAITMTSDTPDAMVAGISQRQAQLASVEVRIRVLNETPAQIGNELDRVEVEARKRLTQFTEFLSAKGEKGRSVVAAALVGPITATAIQLPQGKRFRLEAEARIGKLLGSEVSNYASPGGFEPPLAT